MLRIQQSKILLYSAPVLLALFFAGSILFLKPIYFIALVGIMVVLPLFVIYPEVGLVFYATSLGFIDPIFDSLGVPSGLRALPIALLLAAMLMFFVLRKKTGIRLGALPIVSTGIGILFLLGLTWTPSPEYGYWKAQAYVLYNLLIMFGLISFLGEKERLVRIVYTAAFLGVIYSLIGFFFLPSFLKGSLGIDQFSIPILTATDEGDPVGLAYSLGVFILALILLIEISHSKMQKFFFLISVIGLLFLLLNTSERGPTFSLFLTFVLYLYSVSKAPHYKKILILFVLGVVFYLFFSQLPPVAQDRYLEMLQGRGHQLDMNYQGGRMEIMRVTMQAIKTHFLKGLGTGGFSHLYYLADVRSYPHNLILEMILEFGVLGLITIGIFLFFNIKVVFAVINTRKPLTKDNLILIWASLIFVYCFINSMISFDVPGNKLLWFASGLLWTVYITNKRMGKGIEVKIKN
ncbi:hypothetical protein BAC3_00197 [uncultured bacterium]|nr:hypothetical protein BAC3_00197 [uncultured bacterium]